MAWYMKIEAVKMMRDIRDQMSKDIKGMTWEEEQSYLRDHAKSFELLASNEGGRSRFSATDVVGER